MDAEYCFDKKCLESSAAVCHGFTQHVDIDHAETVLLSYSVRRLGLVYLSSGHMFDVLDIKDTNMKEIFVFGASESHWSAIMKANFAVSM